MLGVLQAIINGQQPDMRAVHRLHELIVSGDLNGDVSFQLNACDHFTAIPDISATDTSRHRQVPSLSYNANFLLIIVIMCLLSL